MAFLVSLVLSNVLKRNLTLSSVGNFCFHIQAVTQEVKDDTYATGRLS